MRRFKLLVFIFIVTLSFASCSNDVKSPNVSDEIASEPFSLEVTEPSDTTYLTESETKPTTTSEETTSATTSTSAETTTVTTVTTTTTTKATTTTTTVTTATESQPTAYPELDLLDPAMEKAIIEDYAKFADIDCASVLISGFYGTYDAGAVVLMNLNTTSSNERIEFALGDNWFDISGSQMMYLYSGGTFTEIYIAYNEGLLSNNDAAEIYHYFSELGVTAPDLPSYLPDLEPLSDIAKQTLIDDYLQTLDKYALEDALEFGGAYIAKYYGTYNDNEVVMMKYYGLQESDSNSLLNVAGYEFRFATGYTNITLHYNGGFIPLSDAYSQGLLTREDIAAICYYSKHT